MSLFRTFFLDNPELATSEVPVLTVPYTQLPTVALGELLAPLAPQITYESDTHTGDGLLAEVSWGSHTVQLAGLAAPIPAPVLARSLHLAPWEPTFLADVDTRQQAHWLVRYSGVHTKGTEQYLALYQLLACLDALPEVHQPLAVLNEPAYTAHPFQLCGRVAAHPQTALEIPPVEFYAGINGFDLEDGTWLLTRGYRLLGQPELAYFPAPGADLHQAVGLLHEVFLYRHAKALEGSEVQVGDVLFLDPHGYYELLAGTELMELTHAQAPIEILRAVPPENVEALLENPS